MKNPELFHKTISILVNAYRNDTLLHGSCHACAVGNLVAASYHIDVQVINKQEADAEWDVGYPSWQCVFMTRMDEGQTIKPCGYFGEAKAQIDSTGYTLEDLAKVELAFESTDIHYGNSGYNSDQHQFDGLMAVVDALMIIHEATTEEAKEAKLLFVK